jgi:hypothetical protein
MTEETAIEETATEQTAETNTDAVDNMRPEWHLDKFESIEAQAKAYVDLNKTLGEKGRELNELRQSNESLSKLYGSPDDGYVLPEIEGVEFDEASPLLQSFNKLAQENNYSQEHYEEVLFQYAQAQYDQDVIDEDSFKEEMSKLENGEKRIETINNWISANVPEKHREGLADIATSAASVEALEWLLDNKAGKAPAEPIESAGVPTMSMDEIYQMQMAVDSNGERKMRNPEYAAKIHKLMERHVGKGEHQRFVG